MQSNRRLLLLLALGFSLLLSACSGSASAQQGVSSPSAAIDNKGSDTMVNLALAWAEAYQGLHPDVRISVTGGGTGIGMAALANRTTDIANASRAIKAEEIALLEQAGFTPLETIVARDAIGVIVHPSNPVSQLTLQQVAMIYRGQITNWREVGGEDRPIVRLSRETNSGTHVYFLETVVRLGSKTDKSLFSPLTLLLPSSEGIISEVSSNPNAIGYDGLGYITDQVKTVALAANAGAAYVLPSVETVNDKSYPVARDLYMYTPGEPSAAARAYLDWILSADAQKIVLQLGFVPIR